MIKIKLGDIFIKDYIDHQRTFLATDDSVGLYCYCIDMNSGERELVKIPLDSSFVTLKVIG